MLSPLLAWIAGVACDRFDGSFSLPCMQQIVLFCCYAERE